VTRRIFMPVGAEGDDVRSVPPPPQIFSSRAMGPADEFSSRTGTWNVPTGAQGTCVQLLGSACGCSGGGLNPGKPKIFCTTLRQRGLSSVTGLTRPWREADSSI
jgi:hypothetical protein